MSSTGPRSLLHADGVVLEPADAVGLRVAFDAFRPASTAVRLSWRTALLPGWAGALTRHALTTELAPGARDVVAEVRAALEDAGLGGDGLVVHRAVGRPDGRHVGVVLVGATPTYVVKVATSAAGRQRLGVEASVLSELSGDPALSRHVPSLVAADAASAWLVTAWAGGTGLTLRELPDAVLSVCGELARREDGTCAELLVASAGRAEALGEREVAAVLAEGARVLGTTPLRFAHGDLAPWNTRRVSQDRYVLVDWETAGQRLPLWDLVHWHVTTAAVWGHGSPAARVRGLLASRSWQAVGTMGRELGLSDEQVRASVRCYAAESALELVERYGTRTGLETLLAVRTALWRRLAP